MVQDPACKIAVEPARAAWHAAPYLIAVATTMAIAVPIDALSQPERALALETRDLVADASPRSRAAEERSMAVQIPESIREEHHEIHSALVQAMQAKGTVGGAARELVKVLDPHFKREEEIALPPLGLLEPLSQGRAIPEAAAAEVLKMSDALRAELPRMMEEHKQIHAAVEKFRAAARAEKAPEMERLADELSLHARTEEEVLYPTAILVGDILRAKERKP